MKRTLFFLASCFLLLISYADGQGYAAWSNGHKMSLDLPLNVSRNTDYLFPSFAKLHFSGGDTLLIAPQDLETLAVMDSDSTDIILNIISPWWLSAGAKLYVNANYYNADYNIYIMQNGLLTDSAVVSNSGAAFSLAFDSAIFMRITPHTPSACLALCKSDSGVTYFTIHQVMDSIEAHSGGGSGWNLTGNAGTNPAVNFIGTTDIDTLHFGVGGAIVATFDIDQQNTFIGLAAGRFITSGGANNAFGIQALQNDTSGSSNVAVGNAAGFLVTSGSNNSFIGASSGVIPGWDTVNNSTAIGSGARVGCSNCGCLGDTGAVHYTLWGIGTAYPSAGLTIHTNNNYTYGFQLVDGTQASGNVLTSDANGNASWQAPGGGGGPITDSIHISSAQLLALPVTPVQLEPGIPGHNYQILSIREDYTFLTSGYSSGVDLIVTQDNTLTGGLFSDQGNIGIAGSGTVFFLSQNQVFPSAVRGDALTIYANSALTGGLGSVDIFITYTIQ